jgi:hypothetical protein
LATAVAIGTAGLLTYDDYSFPVATLLAWLAVVVLVGGLVSGPGVLFPGAIAGLSLLTLAEFLDGTLPARVVPLVSAGLLASAEFGYWSFEFRWNLTHAKSTVLRRAGVILGLVLAGGALSGTALAALSISGAPL